MDNRHIDLLIAVVLVLISFGSQAYEMPIGIPTPNFESPLSNPITATIPAQPAGWPDRETAGYYYVDNSSSNSTDSANPYGFPDKPRKTIPTIVSAGSIVEVRGGPYVLAGDFTINMAGTASAPVYVYGINNPVVSGSRSRISGSHFIFDGFRLTATRLIMADSSYATIRNTEISGPSTQNGVSLGGHHIVFYHNDVHHHQGDDKHGITITQGSTYVWVLDNLLHHNGGDGIQFCHGCSTNPPTYIFIGRNTAYGNRENGIDLKYGRNIVVSQNETYNHHAIEAGVEFCYDDNSGCTTGSSGSDGASIVVGSDGAPSNVWVIFNHVHDSGKGIRIEEAYDGVLLGNLIHDVALIGIEFEKAGEGPNTVAFNTIHKTKKGIKGPWQSGSLEITIENNILSDINGTSLEIDDNATDCVANNNLFYNEGNAVTIRWQNIQSSFTHGDLIDEMVGGTNNIVGDPRFNQVELLDFSLTTGSAAINQANTHLVSLDERFRSLFGSNLTVLKDFTNHPRFANGTAHDIGAFVQAVSTGRAPPSAPVLLSN